jgi:hypothetical protein
MDIILEGYKTKLTNIYKDRPFIGYYTIELSVSGVRFTSVAVFSEEEIREKFFILENEFNELLNS